MDAVQRKVVEAVDEDFIVRTTKELIEIPSPTGFEGEAAKYMAERYRDAGLDTHMQELSAGRYNAVGLWPGNGGGYSLMFNGHLDTSYTGEETQLNAPGYKNKAIRDGEWIFGNGSRNMKSADVTFLAAIHALQKAKVSLKGDIVIAAVAGEIEKNPSGDFQGPHYDGYGSGTKHLITHGFLTDYCILGEPTGLKLATHNGGTLWFKITTTGPMGHICYGEFAPSAIELMEWVQAEIREWRKEYTARNHYMGWHAQVNIAAVNGGWPYRCGRTAMECCLYVDVRILPGQRIQDVRQQFTSYIRSLNEKEPSLGAVVETFASLPPTGISRDSFIVRIISDAHETVTDESVREHFSPTYMDSTHLNRYGVQTILYGGPGRVRTADFGWMPDLGEHVYIPDLVTAAQVNALAALDLCSRDRNPQAFDLDPFSSN